jgi:hypothetical protein
MSSDRPFELGQGPLLLPPPRPSSDASSESERRSSRTLASVYSILNPSSFDDAERRSRRRSAAQMEDDSPLISPTMSNIPGHRPGSSGGRSGEVSPPPGFAGRPQLSHSRRILTPISPALHRTASLSKIITGTIDAASTPFPSPDTTTGMNSSEPMHQAIPPLHSFGPMTNGRLSFVFSQPQQPQAPGTLMIPRRNSVSILPSNRASPSPSTYSGYSQSAQVSPSLYPQSQAPTPPGSFSLAPSPNMGPSQGMGSVMRDPEYTHGIPLPQGSQSTYAVRESTYELRMIETSKGPVPVPVEVHVASRQADEKRKRNAGASARFRQRRKEKEHQANTTIDKLRTDLYWMTEDCEHYKSERNRIRELLKDTPGWDHHPARSPSPPSNRRPDQSVQATSSGGLDSGAVSPRSPTPASSMPGTSAIPESERNTRRKLDVEQPTILPKPDSFGQPEFRSPFPPFHRSGLPSPESLHYSTPLTSLPPHHNHQLPRVEPKPPVPVYGHNWSTSPPNGHG